MVRRLVHILHPSEKVLHQPGRFCRRLHLHGVIHNRLQSRDHPCPRRSLVQLFHGAKPFHHPVLRHVRPQHLSCGLQRDGCQSRVARVVRRAQLQALADGRQHHHGLHREKAPRRAARQHGAQCQRCLDAQAERVRLARVILIRLPPPRVLDLRLVALGAEHPQQPVPELGAAQQHVHLRRSAQRQLVHDADPHQILRAKPAAEEHAEASGRPCDEQRLPRGVAGAR
mmetsp:Transcript_23345/g.75189  ORF Transcript_23345/g.75189 Transcript_23345/m.75189 type:complete len:227 (-) Transcript_23345:791-1471(-)